jgi:hypothetical protein
VIRDPKPGGRDERREEEEGRRGKKRKINPRNLTPFNSKSTFYDER